MNAFIREMFRPGLYKRTQGRITRQVTFATIALAVLLGVWRLNDVLMGRYAGFRLAILGVLLLLGVWAAYRVVNVPSFADFLIAVEAEMAKVSWPSRGEIWRSSAVVLVTIFAMAIMLFVFDVFWQQLFKLFGVL